MPKLAMKAGAAMDAWAAVNAEARNPLKYYACSFLGDLDYY